jgi:hypothetical protein
MDWSDKPQWFKEVLNPRIFTAEAREVYQSACRSGRAAGRWAKRLNQVDSDTRRQKQGRRWFKKASEAGLTEAQAVCAAFTSVGCFRRTAEQSVRDGDRAIIRAIWAFDELR